MSTGRCLQALTCRQQGAHLAGSASGLDSAAQARGVAGAAPGDRNGWPGRNGF